MLLPDRWKADGGRPFAEAARTVDRTHGAVVQNGPLSAMAVQDGRRCSSPKSCLTGNPSLAVTHVKGELVAQGWTIGLAVWQAPD